MRNVLEITMYFKMVNFMSCVKVDRCAVEQAQDVTDDRKAFSAELHFHFCYMNFSPKFKNLFFYFVPE